MNPFYAQNRAERSLKKRSGRSNVAFLVPFFLCFSLLFGSLQGCVNSIHDPDLDAPALPRWPRFALPHPARQVVCLPVLPPLLRHAYSSAKCMILAKSLCKIPWQMWCDVPKMVLLIPMQSFSPASCRRHAGSSVINNQQSIIQCHCEPCGGG